MGAIVLMAHIQIWGMAGCLPHPEALLEPTKASLELAKASAKTLRRIAEEHFDAPDGLGIFALEMAKAAEAVQSLHWDVVHAEKFHLTP